jgi:hypothetical protein
VRAPRDRLTALGLAGASVALGVGVSAIQYLPFYAYIPYSPRDSSVLHDYAWSAAYAIPWSHVLELFIPRFTGESFDGTYWGPNGLKLHSEYLGLAVVALAAIGARDRTRRKMIVWLSGIGAIFLLIALGSATPFYRLWWEIVPFTKSMRAPGMALFLVAFVVACFAAFGVDRITAGESQRFPRIALIVGGVVAFLGIVGVWGAMAESLGSLIRPDAAGAAAAMIRWSSTVAGLVLAGVGALAWGRNRGALGPRAHAWLLVMCVGLDLFLNTRPFWRYSRVTDELARDDEIKSRLRAIPRPFRVWDATVYGGAALMVDDIAQLYGHHGNEPHAFDLLNGRIGESLSYQQEGNPRLLELFGVNYLIVPATGTPDSLPGFRRTVANVSTSAGVPASLFERIDTIPYARFIPAAAPSPVAEQTVAALLQPAFPVNQLVLLDSVPGMAPGTIPSPLPPVPAVRLTVDQYQPGHMRVQIRDPLSAPGYVLVSENWDAPWRARVDGRDARVLRGDETLITVPVPVGAREIVLSYENRLYALGRMITLTCLGVVLVALLATMLRRPSAGSNKRL